jgi:predicted short-subunit dehydrogenase-like oxidoreductase (DUF2520 family)
MEKQKIGFIGAGKVGTALAARLFKGGYPVAGVADMDMDAAQKLADMAPGCHVFKNAQELADNIGHIFITTPDDFIPKVASEITWRSGQQVVHCSGGASIDILKSAENSGALVGSFHPCQAFAGVEKAIENLPGSTFAIEAQGHLLDVLKDMAFSIKCNWILLGPGNKALYHAAAVFVSNYVVTLIKTATDLFKNFNISTEQATEILMPLIQGNINNIKNIGIPSCLTGPIARGDISTIDKHISSIREKEPDILSLYGKLGLKTIPIALAKGTIDEDGSNKLQTLLEGAAKGIE